MGRKRRTKQKQERVSNKSDTLTSLPLTPHDIISFQKKGFVRLRRAFPKEVAAQCRSLIWSRLTSQHGISPTDPSTWVERQGIPECFSPKSPPWSFVMTARLTNAIHQLCGTNRWKEFDLGWWVINFPGAYYTPPWGPSGHWHVDGSHYRHRINSKESGLIAIMLFNDVKADAGGTALSVGSHVTVSQILLGAESGLKGSEVSHEAIKRIRNHEVDQAIGDAGDVYLVHPFLVHARGKNLGENVGDVRFMCNPNIELIRPMRFTKERLRRGRFQGAFTPVEQAIVNAVSGDG